MAWVTMFCGTGGGAHRSTVPNNPVETPLKTAYMKSLCDMAR